MCKTPDDMRIACLAWGSLVWDPRELPVEGAWLSDGPFAPVEFSRQSVDGRITLVIEPKSMPLAVLWARMVPSDLSIARKALGEREGLLGTDWSSKVGSWQRGESPPFYIPCLPDWAEARGLDAIVWTALKPRFGNQERNPSSDEVIDYLLGLSGQACRRAKEYIIRAPAQIDTFNRRKIASAIGWSSADHIVQ